MRIVSTFEWISGGFLHQCDGTQWRPIWQFFRYFSCFFSRETAWTYLEQRGFTGRFSIYIPLNSDRLSVMEECKVITTAIFKDFKSNVNPIIIVIANPVFMSVPAVLTNKGAFSVSDFTCSSDELAALKVSARRLAGYCKFWIELRSNAFKWYTRKLLIFLSGL